MTEPEEIWGNKFKTKYKTMVAKSYSDRTQVSPAMRREIIGLVRNTFNGEKVSMQYPRNNITFDVILVQAPKQITPRQFPSGDYSLGVQWKGSWVSAILTQERLKRIEPDKFYVIVGFLKLKAQYRNFYVRDIITLDQIKDLGDSGISNDEEPVKEELEVVEAEPEMVEGVATKEITPETVQ